MSAQPAPSEEDKKRLIEPSNDANESGETQQSLEVQRGTEVLTKTEPMSLINCREVEDWATEC